MKASLKEVRRVELLFEIGCEEIPAGMLPRAEEELKANIEKLLAAEDMMSGVTVETYGGPRRLTARVKGLLAKQEDSEVEVTGPPKSVAYDAVGAPTRAAVSFSEKHGVSLDKIYFVATSKGEYLAVKLLKRGRAAEQTLKEILPRAIHDLTWPKSMTWTGLDGARFIRPIRWIVALLDGKPLKFTFGGVASGDTTNGHRFLGKPGIRVRNFADYEKRLRANGVILRPEERRAKIEREVAALAKRGGYRVHQDAVLLRLLTYLNEFPTVMEGNFDPAFLELPDEILVTVMRGHQKYFAVEKRNGELAPHFLAVINLAKDTKGLVRAGHERVLRARFADARFFWNADQKCRLADYLPKLGRVTYESRLGSYRDKVERSRTIARWLTVQWFNHGILQAHVAEADRAAELAKCDLATDMVREFPELQGVVGGLYARVQSEPEDVAAAVYDHYRPAGMDDLIPRNLTGCAVALADKLDSVVGCFAVGVVPTGSSDPYALRRAALGIVKIILDKKLPVSLSLAIAEAAKTLHALAPKRAVKPEQQAQILEFLLDRARFVFREKEGFGYDEVKAVLEAGNDDLVDAQKRLVALKAIRKSKNFEPLAVSFKRIRKILEKADAADLNHHIREDLLEAGAERELHAAVAAASANIVADRASRNYLHALEAVAGLRKYVDRYFQEVMVMAEDQAVRRNRLALLHKLKQEVSAIAYLEEIGGEEAR